MEILYYTHTCTHAENCLNVDSLASRISTCDEISLRSIVNKFAYGDVLPFQRSNTVDLFLLRKD